MKRQRGLDTTHVAIYTLMIVALFTALVVLAYVINIEEHPSLGH